MSAMIEILGRKATRRKGAYEFVVGHVHPPA
jgi:hypothetical protein